LSTEFFAFFIGKCASLWDGVEAPGGGIDVVA